MRRLATAAVLAAPFFLWGCVTTRAGQFGPLANNEHLVTLVVSVDRSVVERECRDALALGPVLGCGRSQVVTLQDGRTVRTVKIVRYAQALPSVTTFEIDIHELCHAIATVQRLTDPCHRGNGGMLQSGAPPRRAIR